MGCSECERETKLANRIFWYRWKNANVAIMGCKKHVSEIMEALSKAQAAENGSQKRPVPTVSAWEYHRECERSKSGTDPADYGKGWRSFDLEYEEKGVPEGQACSHCGTPVNAPKFRLAWKHASGAWLCAKCFREEKDPKERGAR